MGNTKWTTPAEEKFLLANVPQYEAAQAAKKVHQYLLSFDLRWLMKFAEYSDGRNTTPAEVLKKVSSPHRHLVLELNTDCLHRREFGLGSTTIRESVRDSPGGLLRRFVQTA